MHISHKYWPFWGRRLCQVAAKWANFKRMWSLTWSYLNFLYSFNSHPTQQTRSLFVKVAVFTGLLQTMNWMSPCSLSILCHHVLKRIHRQAQCRASGDTQGYEICDLMLFSLFKNAVYRRLVLYAILFCISASAVPHALNHTLLLPKPLSKYVVPALLCLSSNLLPSFHHLASQLFPEIIYSSMKLKYAIDSASIQWNH